MFLKKLLSSSILLLTGISLYYLLFINKGIVIYDEGYYAHIAERIINGEVAYKDFFLQFTPGYFYLLAFFYKIFGPSVLIGRILTFIFCLGIAFLSLQILDKFKASLKLKILAMSSVAAFGFPLINSMAILAWVSVFLSLFAVLNFINKKYILLGITLSLILFTKQNLGIYFFIATNICLFFLNSKTKTKALFFTNLTFLLFTVVWISYFFLILNGPDRLIELINFSSRYVSIYSFSYPPLSFLTQPTGIFKLLPYYLPLIFGFFLLKEFLNKKKEINSIYFSTVALIGFLGTIYPTSDLLHIYPFFGSFLVSSVVLFRQKRYFYWRILVLLLIGTGFYLTLFREYYRYQPAYRYQKFKTEIPRLKNIYVDEPLATDLSNLNLFFLANTKKNDPILCYPFCPMVYFILERENPTRYANYYPGYLTLDQEEEVVRDIKSKKVKFIVTFLDYRFDRPISRFIQSQQVVLQRGQFKIFEVK